MLVRNQLRSRGRRRLGKFSSRRSNFVTNARRDYIASDDVVVGSSPTGSTIEPTPFSDPIYVLRALSGVTLEADANFKWTFVLDELQPAGYYTSKLTIEDGVLNVANGANFTFEFYGTEPLIGIPTTFWDSNRVFPDVIDVIGIGEVGSIGTFDIDNSQWASLGYFSTTTTIGGPGVDLKWTVVPEPTSFVSLLSGLGLLVGVRRPRRRV